MGGGLCVKGLTFNRRRKERDDEDGKQTSSFQSMRVAYSDHSSAPVCGFSMMEQVRLCTVRPKENWIGTSKTTYRVG